MRGWQSSLRRRELARVARRRARGWSATGSPRAPRRLLEPEQLHGPAADLVPEPDGIGVEEPLVGLADRERPLHPGVQRIAPGRRLRGDEQEPRVAASPGSRPASAACGPAPSSSPAPGAPGRPRAARRVVRVQPVVVRHACNLPQPGTRAPAVGSARCSSSASRAASARASPRCPRCLAAKGAVIIDADAITRELQQPGTEVFAAMVERFGEGILAPDGTLDRPAVADLVFNDPDALKDLGGIVHPAVGVEIARRLEAEVDTDHLVVLDVPAARGVRARRHGRARGRRRRPRGRGRPARRAAGHAGGGRAGPDGPPGVPRGAAGQGRPRDRQLRHARRPRARRIDELWPRLLALGART